MAAVITATSVSSVDHPTGFTTGLNRRYKTLLLEGPKAAQNDWFLLSSYISLSDTYDNIQSIYATVDDNTNTALDTFTYTNATGKLVLSGATTGTARVTVVYYEP